MYHHHCCELLDHVKNLSCTIPSTACGLLKHRKIHVHTLRAGGTPAEQSYRKRHKLTHPRDHFSKLGYSATSAIPKPNDRFSDSSRRDPSNTALVGTDNHPAVEYLSFENRSRGCVSWVTLVQPLCTNTAAFCPCFQAGERLYINRLQRERSHLGLEFFLRNGFMIAERGIRNLVTRKRHGKLIGVEKCYYSALGATSHHTMHATALL